MPRGSRFEIGERVYHNGKPYYITGMNMRICYDLIAWEYWVTYALYGDHPFESFGGKTDSTTIGPIREEQIKTKDEWSLEHEKYLLDRKKELEDEIATLSQERIDIWREVQKTADIRKRKAK